MTVKTTDFVYEKARRFATTYGRIDQEVWALFVDNIPPAEVDMLLTEWKGLAQQGRLSFLSQAQAYLAKQTPELKAALTAEVEGLVADTTFLVDEVITGLKTAVPSFEPPMNASERFAFVQNSTDRTRTALNAMEEAALTPLSKIIPQYDAAFGDAINNAILRTTQGQATNVAVDNAVQQLAKQNVFTVTYKNGAKVPAKSYVEMVTRTEMLNIHRETQASRMREYGLNLVEISSHSTADELCTPWQGRVFCLDGTTDRYESLDTAVGGGLYHYSCRHMQFPYVEGVSEPSDPVSDAELADDKQVRNEYNRNQARIDKDQRLLTADAFLTTEEASRLEQEVATLEARQRELTKRDVLQPDVLGAAQ